MSGRKATKQMAAGPHFSSITSWPVNSVTSGGETFVSSYSRANDSIAEADLAPSYGNGLSLSCRHHSLHDPASPCPSSYLKPSSTLEQASYSVHTIPAPSIILPSLSKFTIFPSSPVLITYGNLCLKNPLRIDFNTEKRDPPVLSDVNREEKEEDMGAASGGGFVLHIPPSSVVSSAGNLIEGHSKNQFPFHDWVWSENLFLNAQNHDVHPLGQHLPRRLYRIYRRNRCVERESRCHIWG